MLGTELADSHLYDVPAESPAADGGSDRWFYLTDEVADGSVLCYVDDPAGGPGPALQHQLSLVLGTIRRIGRRAITPRTC